jgi:hypothetical protein
LTIDGPCTADRHTRSARHGVVRACPDGADAGTVGGIVGVRVFVFVFVRMFILASGASQ